MIRGQYGNTRALRYVTVPISQCKAHAQPMWHFRCHACKVVSQCWGTIDTAKAIAEIHFREVHQQ